MARPATFGGARSRVLPRLGALAMYLLAGCSSTASVSGGSPEPTNRVLETGTFEHAQHLGLLVDGKPIACEACHTLKPGSKTYETVRPGSNAHAPCDGCHQQAFFQPPGPLCMTCHVSIDAFAKGNSPLKAYPRQGGRAQLISNFNHKTHIERNKDRVKEGGQFACEACHQVPNADAAYASFPGHETCGFCHGEVAAPKMASCGGCHVQDGPTKGRHFLGNDIRFTHGKHRADTAGQRIDCAVCHASIKDCTTASEIVLPQMKDCAQCHESSARTPENVRIEKCGVCHTTDVNKVNLPGNHTAGLDLDVLTGGGHAVLAWGTQGHAR